MSTAEWTFQGPIGRWWCGRLNVVDNVMNWQAGKNLGDYTMFETANQQRQGRAASGE